MQLQGAAAFAAAVVEEFSTVYLPLLIFFIGAKAVPHRRPQRQRKEKGKNTCSSRCAPGEADTGVFGQASPWHRL